MGLGDAIIPVCEWRDVSFGQHDDTTGSFASNRKQLHVCKEWQNSIHVE